MAYPSVTLPPPPGGWPRISVVVPSYNQGRFLAGTLSSILSQNYPNLECIVVDGGSTDNSCEIIEAHAAHLAWWCSEKDGGHADALNKGFSRATGEVMCWLNSDDLMAPWGLWVIGDIFARFPQVEWLTGNACIWDAHGRLVATYPGGATIRDYLEKPDFDIQQESTFWRRSLWTRAGAKIDDSYRLMIDTNLWMRFFRYAKLHSLGTPVSGYRLHGANRALTHADQVRQERWRAIEEHAKDCHGWRAKLVIDMGLEPPHHGAGILQWLRRKTRKRIRNWALSAIEEAPPRISWDNKTQGWILADSKPAKKK